MDENCKISEVRLLKPDGAIPLWGYEFVALCITAPETAIPEPLSTEIVA